MTVEQMSLAFDMAFNNIRSNQAPGVDPYEKSLLLTRAMHDIEEGLYASTDKNELVRKKLSRLIKSKSFKSEDAKDSPILGKYAKDFTITDTDKVRAVLHESILYDKCDDVCVSDTIADVKPTTYDTLDSMVGNPFIFTIWRALRLDLSDGTNKACKIITKTNDAYTYTVEYVKIANPIFVSGCLDGDVIDGVSYVSTESYECELDETVHQAIVDLAVRMATEDYKS